MAGDAEKPVTKPNLRKGEVYERFFASLPEYGVQDWNWAECKRVQATLKRCYFDGARSVLSDRIWQRMRQLEKEGNHEA